MKNVRKRIFRIASLFLFSIFFILISCTGDNGGSGTSGTKDIISFMFEAANNVELSSDVTGTVGATMVALTVPFGTDVTALNPTIVHTGASVLPASLADQDFTNPVTYTVTADDSSTKDYTITVTVAEEPALVMHIADIAMSIKQTGPNVEAIATVTVLDDGGIHVEGATVSGYWSGLTEDIDSGITNETGTVSLNSDKVKNANGTFTFTVDGITKDGWNYDSAANIETSDSITVP